MGRNTELICGLRGQIITQLRKDIYAGRLVAGEKLSEVSLAERFNVSRTPIREALHQLTPGRPAGIQAKLRRSRGRRFWRGNSGTDYLYSPHDRDFCLAILL